MITVKGDVSKKHSKHHSLLWLAAARITHCKCTGQPGIQLCLETEKVPVTTMEIKLKRPPNFPLHRVTCTVLKPSRSNLVESPFFGFDLQHLSRFNFLSERQQGLSAPQSVFLVNLLSTQ